MQRTQSITPIDDVKAPGYLELISSHPRVLSFGVVLTLFSSFGQTFLISIFVDQMLGDFALNTAQFGMLYAGATLTGALCLPFFGRLMDRSDLRRYSLMVGAGLMMACLWVSMAREVWMLFVGILGLRLTGQGLLSLTATTTMARTFDRTRGKALSVSGLGFPLGEGVLPLVVVFLIHAVGWRMSWAILACFIGLVLLPLIFQLSRGVPSRGQKKVVRETPRDEGDVTWTRARVLRDPRFYFVLPSTLLLPFIATGLFLYQLPLAEFKGWSMTLMATGFVGFAIGRFACAILVGPIIDRFGAVNIFPFILLPLGAGLLALHFLSAEWAAIFYLVMIGISQGLAGSIMTALWAEVYGTESLGAIKSMISMLGIVGTAISPIMLGFLIQWGVSFAVIVPCLIGAVVVASALSLWISFRFRGDSKVA